jgi:phosphatidylglycerol:prolipoprotein diacylglycerol transferase
LIEIPFDPEIHLGPISLAWHGIFTAVGIFFGVWLAIRLLRGRVSEDAGYSVATWGVVGGILGARLLHVADRWDFYSIGGVLGGFIIALRRRDVPVGAAADAAAAGIGLGFGIGRIGDVINGEHHALPCEGAGICVGYTNPATLGQPGPVHLAIGYEMIWDLLGVGLVLWLLRRFAGRQPEGRIFWTWLVSYAIGRWAFGYLRVGDPTPFAGLRQDQVVAVAVLLVAIAALALLQSGMLTRVFGHVRGATAT